MLAVVVAAIVVVACSAAVGQGLCALSGRREWAWWSPGVGFAAVVTLTGVLIRVPGHSKSAAAGVALATLAALAFPSVRRALLHALPDGIPVALIALLASLIPFLVWRRTGILGEGVNNDSGAHLGTAWWLQHQRGPAPVGALGGGLAVVGYPVGPHGLIDAIALGRISLEHAFDGMLIAIAPLTALVGLGGLPNARRPARWVAAVLVGLAYLAVSFEMQASFKETIEALLVVTTALCARDVVRTGGRRAVIPLGIAIAGSVYIYSYGGLVWPVAVAGAVALSSGRLREWVHALPALAITAAVVVAPSIHQFIRFADSPFNHESGQGNLRHALSAFEVLGVWFNYDFRWTPNPLWPTAIGIAVVTAAALVALLRLLRAREVALPAAVAPVLVIYAYAAAAKSIYLSAKALTVAAPLVALAVAAGLLLPGALPRGRRIALTALACAAAALAAVSSFLVLRDARVGPLAHRAELAQLKPRIKDGKVLFMPKDDLAQWDLVGLAVWQPRNFYSPLYVAPRLARPITLEGFYDFDNFTPSTLDKFRYAITTNTPYQSSPPPNWHAVARTRSYILWRRHGPTTERYATDFGSTPGRIFKCSSAFGQLRLGGAGAHGYALVLPRPVVGLPLRWRGQPAAAGQSATMALRLPHGRWDLSLAYAGNTGLTVVAGGLRADMPATIDRVGPYYYVGTVRQRRSGVITVRVTANRLGWFGRLIGADGRTRGLDTPLNVPLGGIAFTRHDQHGRKVPAHAACGRYVDHIVPRA